MVGAHIVVAVPTTSLLAKSPTSLRNNQDFVIFRVSLTPLPCCHLLMWPGQGLTLLQNKGLSLPFFTFASFVFPSHLSLWLCSEPTVASAPSTALCALPGVKRSAQPAADLDRGLLVHGH